MLTERQTQALFGDIKALQADMQSAVGQDASSMVSYFAAPPQVLQGAARGSWLGEWVTCLVALGYPASLWCGPCELRAAHGPTLAPQLSPTSPLLPCLWHMRLSAG